MNRIVDEIEAIAGDSNGQIYYDEFLTLMRKWSSNILKLNVLSFIFTKDCIWYVVPECSVVF